jgi:GT2 family glycosyltransferase
MLLRALAAARRLATERTPLSLLEPIAFRGDRAGFSPTSLGGRERNALNAGRSLSVEWRVYVLARSQVQVWCGLLGDIHSHARFLVEVLHGDRRAAATTGVTRAGRWTRLRLRVPSDVNGQAVIRMTAVAEGNASLVALAEPEVIRRKPAALTLRTGANALRVLGIRGVIQRLDAGSRLREDDERYAAWRAAHARADEHLPRVREEIDRAVTRPRISIITAVYNTDPLWLRACIESVRRQIYREWELCLADDGSTRPETQATLQAYEGTPGIRIVYGAGNRGIVHASNAALALASGEFVAFLDHDDEIEPDALAEVARAIAARPDLDVVYTDEDKVDPSGIRSQPHFKPDWSPELLRSCMYMSHLTVIRRDAVLEAGGFRAGYDGSQDYDLMLRVTERTDRIAHIPRVLYSWRTTPASAASSQLSKPWAVDAGRRALEDCLRRVAFPAHVLHTNAAGHFRVRYAIGGSPLVSILITTTTAVPRIGPRGVDLLITCLQAISRTTRGRAIELVIVHEGPVSDAARRLLDRALHRLIPRRSADGPPNLAERLNQAARAATGDHLLFMHDDVEPMQEGWLDALIEFSQQEAVGAVGPFLVHPDGRLDHAGIVLGAGGVAAHAFQGEPASTRGHMANALDVRNCSAVSGACLLTRRAVFEQVGGLEERVGRELYDVDYGLRVRRAGLRVVVTPHAAAYHHTVPAKPRGRWPAEVQALRAIWDRALDEDPYYNANFHRERADYRLPPLADRPR